MGTIAALLAGACVLTGAANAGGDPCAELADLFADHIMVRPAPGTTLEAFIDTIEQDHPSLVAAPVDAVPGRPIHLLQVQLPPEWGPLEIDQFGESLEAGYGGLLAWGEFLYSNETPEGKTGSTFVDRPINLQMVQNQYVVEQIGSSAAQSWSTGAGVVVAVIDTGVDHTHPLIAGSIAPGGYNFVDSNDDARDLGDEQDTDGDGLVDEMVGHGTFVAGLIRVVAPDAKILPIRVIDSDGNGNLWTMMRGMFHAIDRGVEVMNISIASTYDSQGVDDAIEEAKDLGIIVVAAGGNCDQEEPREFPAMDSNAFGVAAVDDNDIKAEFSNYNDRLFISAPGASEFINGEPDPDQSIMGPIPGENYVYWEGTSMATPLVAGTVALIRAQHPEWPASELTYDLIESVLESSVVNIDDQNPAYVGLLGVGRLNAEAAVNFGPVAPAPGDLDNNGMVNIIDLLAMLGDWNLVHSSADLNGDGGVNVLDLLILLGNWG